MYIHETRAQTTLHSCVGRPCRISPRSQARKPGNEAMQNTTGELSTDLFCDVRIRKNCHYAGVQGDSSFYRDLGEWRDICL